MRRKKAKEIVVLPDPKYKDLIVTKFVNNMMLSGKKNVAYNIFYEAMAIIEERTEEGAGLDTFKKALNNVTPGVEVRSRRVGGATFQIPQEVRNSRKQSLAMKWLIKYSRARNEKTMGMKLANEFMAAAKEEGAAYKKKEDTHRMAEANKAFSHFRF
jgi:small subunit ribosomal protein S7